MATGNYMANQAGMELYKTDATDDEASEKLLKGYMSYILDFFKTYELDAENIENGYYRKPYDSDPKMNKQFNPAFVLDQLRRARKVGIETIDRRDRDGWNEIPFDSNMYPEYYLRNFHYQTDGWMSSDSAKIYEF